MKNRRSATSKSLGRKPSYLDRLNDANISQSYRLSGGLAYSKQGPNATYRAVARGDVVDYAPIKRFMGQVVNSFFDTKNNYSNMGKTYGEQGAKFRAKVAKNLKEGLPKVAKNPDNKRNYP